MVKEVKEIQPYKLEYCPDCTHMSLVPILSPIMPDGTIDTTKLCCGYCNYIKDLSLAPKENKE